MGTTVPESLTLTRAMSVILRAVQLPGSPHTHAFALNTFAYWMGHPEARIIPEEVTKFMLKVHGLCENQGELDAFGYINYKGVSAFRPGLVFPWRNMDTDAST